MDPNVKVDLAETQWTVENSQEIKTGDETKATLRIERATSLEQRSSSLRFEDRLESEISIKKSPSAQADVQEQKFPSFFLNTNKYVVLFIYLFIILLCGNVYFGWAGGLREMLFKQGAYSWVCDGSTSDKTINAQTNRCKQQETDVANVYTVGYTLHFVMSFIAGIAVDKVGPKCTIIVGFAMKIAGYLIFGYSTRDFPAYLAGIVLIAGSNDVAIFPIMTIVEWYPDIKPAVLSFIGACKSFSASIPLIMFTIWEKNEDSVYFEKIFLIYSLAFIVPLSVPAILFCPWKRYVPAKKKHKKREDLTPIRRTPTEAANDNHVDSADSEEPKTVDGEGTIVSKDAVSEPIINDINKPEKTLLQTIVDPYFALVIPYFTLTLLMNAFMNTAAEEEFPAAYDAWKIALCLRGFSCAALGVVANIVGLFPSFYFIQTLGLCMFIFASISSPVCDWIAMLSLMLFSSYCLTQLYTFIATTQESYYFGTLIGIGSICSGIPQLLNTQLYAWGKQKLDDNFVPVNGLFIGFSCVNLAILSYLFLLHRKRQKLKLQKILSSEQNV